MWCRNEQRELEVFTWSGVGGGEGGGDGSITSNRSQPGPVVTG